MTQHFKKSFSFPRLTRLGAMAFALQLVPHIACSTENVAQAVPRLPSPVLVKWKSTALLAIAAAGSRLVAVGLHGLVLVSEDEGLSWRQIASPIDITLTSVAFLTSNTGFAVGHEESILRTDDGGLTWRVVRTDPGGVPLLRIRFPTATSGFITGVDGTLLSTRDRGGSWERAIVTADDGAFNPQLFDIAELSDGRLILAAEAGHLFRSVDGGRHWEELSSPYVGSFFGALSLGGQSVLAYGMRGHVFLSRNGGDSWNDVDTGVNQSFFDAIATDKYIYLGGGGGVLLKARRVTPIKFDLEPITGRPTISGLISTNRGIEATSDRGLVSNLAASFNP